MTRPTSAAAGLQDFGLTFSFLQPGLLSHLSAKNG